MREKKSPIVFLNFMRMGRSRGATNAAEPEPSPLPPTPRRRSVPRSTAPKPQPSPRTLRSPMPTQAASSSSYSEPSTTTSTSSHDSLSSLRHSLPEKPNIYDFSEISAATNNFLAKRHTSSSPSSTPSWRCTLRGKDVIVFQRKLHRPTSPSAVRQKLSLISRSHHIAVIKLLGASISGGSIYLVYHYVHGSNLAECLRPTNNPSYTVLDTWISRIRIARDLADGLNYIHNDSGLGVRLVHNHIKSSSVVIADHPSRTASICHFGTAELCGEPVEEETTTTESLSSIPSDLDGISEAVDVSVSPPKLLLRSNGVKFRGTPGYMSPEFKDTGIGSLKSDVYAFGVVLLELLSGEKPIRYDYDKVRKDHVIVSLIDTARAAMDDGEGGGEGRLRWWIDERLRDSFPVEVAERMTRLALECVHVEVDKRPDMGRVASKISSLYLKSIEWAYSFRVPEDLTASFAPR